MKRLLIPAFGLALLLAPLAAQADHRGSGREQTRRRTADTCGTEYRYERPAPARYWLKWNDSKGRPTWSVNTSPQEHPLWQPDIRPAVVERPVSE